MVVPLPPHDPAARRRRAPRGRPRPGGLRSLRQAGRTRRATPTSATSTGCCSALLDALDLRDITLVCQDWGGLIGLRCWPPSPTASHGSWSANTFLPTGDRPAGDAFLNWQRFSQEVEVFDCGFIVNMGCDHRPPRRRRRRLQRAVPRRPLHGRRPPVPDARADLARRPERRGQPGRVGRARGLGQALAHRLLRPGPRHRRRRPGASSSACRAPPASPTRPSPAAATSSRRTAGPSSPRS